MNGRNLEMIMREFVAGKYDVLLSTTIIENGLDIPNVNTIIVNRADSLGLSQLYQLRGRVGRSSEQAYAYFLTPSFQQINEVSLKRLRTLEQYTDLGSGFQIAMRDLEIRGAGNILGTYQHGFIAAVGFELFSRLLKEEIDSIMGRKTKEEEKEIKIDIPINAYIPAEYISDSSTRISLYQESSACKDINKIIDIEERIVDRFGPLPETVQALFILMHVKVLGQKAKLSHLSLNKENFLCISLHGKDEELAKHIKDFLSSTTRDFEVLYGTPVVLKTKLVSNTNINKLLEIKKILEKQDK
jgi:transcription-repair coupling factor (superfamily II helicase)